jgi:multidrug efflux pump subunit AcrA (membrane-fusion protein)
MKRTLKLTAIVVVVSMIALAVFIKVTSVKAFRESDLSEVKQGFFEIAVTSAGELIAENSVDIKGPNIVRNRNFRAAPLKITDMVPEGTIVKKGDFVASLDKSGFTNTFKDEQESLRVYHDRYDMKILDTAVVMNDLRNDIRNQEFVASEAKLKLDESKFEPPATQRQAEITLDKELRALEQKKKLYALKKAQTLAEHQLLRIKVASQQRKVDDLDSVLSGFTVKAPSDGMVIYKKDQLGKKITIGTTLNPWDPVVATLPDLSSILSKVFISEIDVNKIFTGQKAEITVDAFKDKNFSGKVQSIANIGEQLPNSDTKVFEVLIRLDEQDPMLRPSMTTGNKLIVKTFDNVIYVPNESVHAGLDSIPFVYTKNKTKQVVVLGESNDKNIIIEEGLEPGTRIWLSVPDNADKYQLAGTELIPVIKEREMARLELNRPGNTPAQGQGSREPETN